MVGSLHENTVTVFQMWTEQKLTARKGVTLNSSALSKKHLMVCNRNGIQKLHAKYQVLFDLFVIFVYSLVPDLKSDFNS